MITEILWEVDQFKSQTNRLKSLSPMYPLIYEEERGDVYWLSSIVRFEYNGVAYNRHHVETWNTRFGGDKKKAEIRLREMAEKTKLLAAPCSLDDIVGVL